MRAVDIIIKKRDKGELSREDIEFFIQEYTRGDIPDYQASALAMAILLNGMTDNETTFLTLAMANSGECLDLSHVVPIAVDKHSTGGVGDKTTLVAEPVVAACGLPVGKMSGRGLGFSGGTLDKMESIPGYRTDLSTQEFLTQLSSIGLVLTGQTADLAPADGMLYELRDVTGTVQAIPLIASSVMSKKIAAGAQAIVLDVKIGLGAFMPNLEEGRRLANLMVSIAKKVGRKAVALLSDMNQPLGNAVGNALELKEAIETLHGRGPQDFRQHCLIVASHMLALCGVAADEEMGFQMAERALQNGSAWEKFVDLVKAQSGDTDFIFHPERLPDADIIRVINSPQEGFLEQINARHVGEAAILLGAGREKKGDAIDYGVGIVLHAKVGAHVNNGQPIFTIYARDEQTCNEAKNHILSGYRWSQKQVEPLPLFYDVLK